MKRIILFFFGLCILTVSAFALYPDGDYGGISRGLGDSRYVNVTGDIMTAEAAPTAPMLLINFGNTTNPVITDALTGLEVVGTWGNANASGVVLGAELTSGGMTTVGNTLSGLAITTTPHASDVSGSAIFGVAIWSPDNDDGDAVRYGLLIEDGWDIDFLILDTPGRITAVNTSGPGEDITIRAGDAISGSGGKVNVFGGTPDGYVKIGLGDFSPTHTLDDDSLGVVGTVEFDGETFLDSTLTLVDDLTLGVSAKVVAESYTDTSGTLWSIKLTPGSSSTADMLYMEANGGQFASGASMLTLHSENANAIPLTVFDGASTNYTLNRSGAVTMAGALTFSGSGVINTGSNLNITLDAGGTGEVVVNDKTTFNDDVLAVLGNDEFVEIDASTTDSATTEGALRVNFDATVAESEGVNVTTAIINNIDDTSGIKSTITPRATGITSNSASAYIAGMSSDDNDFDATYFAYDADDFIDNGGTHESIAFTIGDGWKFGMQLDSGKICFSDYTGTIETITSGDLHLAPVGKTVVFGDLQVTGTIEGASPVKIVGGLNVTGTLDVTGNSPGNVGGFAAGVFQVTSPTITEFSGAVITGHNSFDTVGGNTQLWYLGSSSTSTHNNVTLINRQNADLILSTNNLPRMTIQGDGDVGIGIVEPSSLLTVAGTVESTVGGIKFPDGTIQSTTSLDIDYGEMFQFMNTNATTINVASTWEMVANYSTGQVSGVTYSSNSLEVEATGTYLLNWSCSATVASGTNKVFQFGVGLNGTLEANVQTDTVIERLFATNDVGATSGTSVISLTAGDYIYFLTRNLTDTVDITIKHSNVNLHRL